MYLVVSTLASSVFPQWTFQKAMPKRKSKAKEMQNATTNGSHHLFKILILFMISFIYF